MIAGVGRLPRYAVLCTSAAGLAILPAPGMTAPASAGGKPAAAVVAPVAPTEDPAVTLRLAGEPVVDLLARLSRGTGPTLTATADLGERRVDAFVPVFRYPLPGVWAGKGGNLRMSQICRWTGQSLG